MNTAAIVITPRDMSSQGKDERMKTRERLRLVAVVAVVLGLMPFIAAPAIGTNTQDKCERFHNHSGQVPAGWTATFYEDGQSYGPVVGPGYLDPKTAGQENKTWDKAKKCKTPDTTTTTLVEDTTTTTTTDDSTTTTSSSTTTSSTSTTTSVPSSSTTTTDPTTTTSTTVPPDESTTTILVPTTPAPTDPPTTPPEDTLPDTGLDVDAAKEWGLVLLSAGLVTLLIATLFTKPEDEELA